MGASPLFPRPPRLIDSPRREEAMRITSIHLRNFKRFTDLVVRDIPDCAKLVVVGPNGCGNPRYSMLYCRGIGTRLALA